MERSEAKNALEAAGLAYEDDIDDTAEVPGWKRYIAAGQTPEAGTDEEPVYVGKDDSVSVTFDIKVKVPEIGAATKERATQLLEARGLALGTYSSTTAYGPGSASQNPSAGKFVPKGTPVDVEVVWHVDRPQPPPPRPPRPTPPTQTTPRDPRRP
jgi:beta-lactam-binding protein with PASTA domain